ncbi:MAG TPA: MarR family transcriptional regulator [Streptosporangiaceae bacterium]
MDFSGGPTADGPGAGGPAPDAGDDALATGLAAGLERLIGLFRRLSPPSGLSLTAASALGSLERSGPSRLTWLAVREGVTQPAMTQLIGRLQDAGLVERAADPGDGRVVQIHITADGRAVLARRRAARAELLAELLAQLSRDEQATLAAALPALEALASARHDDPLVPAGQRT